MVNRAVFLDRDGTLNEEVGYLSHVDQLHLFPWTAEAIRLINQAGYRAIVFSNQSGVARGYFTEAIVRQIHEKLTGDLLRDGAYLDAIYYCPHHPEATDPTYRMDCLCRKPKTGMVERGQVEFELDLSRSFIIGDRYLDVECAHRVGARGILVLTGYGSGEQQQWGHVWPRPPDLVAENLLTAVQWIINSQGDRGRMAHENTDCQTEFHR